MSSEGVNRHQLAGLDARERGFSRPVEVEAAGGGYRAILRYETVRVVTEPHDTPAAALEELIRMLQEQGYTQLRSQLSVRNGVYLGSQEPWIEYPDPERQPAASAGLIDRVLSWLRCPAIGS